MPSFGVPLVEAGSTGTGPAIGAESLALDGPVQAGASRGAGNPIRYEYDGPRTRRRLAAALRGRASLARRHFAAAADIGTDGRAVRVHTLGLAVERGALLAFAGALTPRTGPSCGGGVVLAGTSAMVDGEGSLYGVELLATPVFRLPLLGETGLGIQLGFLREAGPGNRRPLFHAMRVETHPAGDLVIGFNRAVIFGGSETTVPITFRTVGLMLIGITDTGAKDSDFENQVASVDARWRGSALRRPLLVTAEYGADDSGYAFLRVPGMRLTGEWAWSPFGSGWSGISLVHLAEPRATYPPWYRHGALAWGWTDRGWPLGTFLGGAGTAALITYRREGARVSVALGAGAVRRGADNLFAPDLEGDGWVVEGDARGTSGSWTWTFQGAMQEAGRRAAWASLSLMHAVGGSPGRGKGE